MFENYLWLIFAHYIGDIALQSEWQAVNKRRYWYVMFSHCMIWTGVICFALKWLGIFELWKVVFLLVGHFVADWTKCTADPNRAPEKWWMIYPDQLWHLTQLIVVCDA
jgi:hypothetical protein